MLNHRTLLKNAQIALNPRKVTISAGDQAPPLQRQVEPAGGGEPRVECRRSQHGRLEALIVFCPCGRTINIDCEYPEEGADQ